MVLGVSDLFYLEQRQIIAFFADCQPFRCMVRSSLHCPEAHARPSFYFCFDQAFRGSPKLYWGLNNSNPVLGFVIKLL